MCRGEENDRFNVQSEKKRETIIEHMLLTIFLCRCFLFVCLFRLKILTSVMHSRYDYDTTYNTKLKNKRERNGIKNRCVLEHGTRDSRASNI